MDPPHLISESSLNPSSSSYNLGEIWPFSVDGYVSNGSFSQNVDQSGRRRGGFGVNLGLGYGESSNRASPVDESTVTEQSQGEMITEQVPESRNRGGRRKRKEVSEDESSKLVTMSSANNGMDFEVERVKFLESTEENGDSKLEVEMSSGVGNKQGDQSVQLAEPLRQDFIHVRARRGQATDSHSLAERARREKISERMKILQDLVPGCNKVIGKALVLDEIINYIQSLQRQVEFLSMKLEAVNSRTSMSLEGFPSKDPGVQTFETAILPYGSQATITYPRSPQEWLHMQVGGGFDRAT